MKVVAINGSARKDGNTAILINVVFDELKKEGIETEMIQFAGNPPQGCIACYKCFENKNKDLCWNCQKVTSFVLCSGCGVPLCEACARFELVGSGCGCVWPVYYCITCARDTMINPNAVFRDPDT